jgi:hypothetical protein
MRARILASTLLLFAAPATALACGGHSEWDSRVSKQYRIPTALDAADAIEAAAVEFGVPVSLLQAVAHTESRWQHHPHRVNPDGRRGLFHLPQDRIDLAADWLNLSWGEANGDVVQHARIFAALLDEARPAIKGRAPTIGEWRGALAWALDLEADFEDRYADNILALVDAGLIDRLPSGEPVVIEPSPVDPAHRGWWAASQDRSADYGPAIWDPAPGCNYSNASRGIGDVDYVIIHTAQGSYSGTINWFKNCSANVSAHYVVSTTGQITQMVDEEDSAWHVSCWNSLSVGIEHEGYAEDPGTWYTTAMYQASAGLVADILASWNLPADRNHVLGHSEIDPACNGSAHWDPGGGWDWTTFMNLVGGSTTPPVQPTNLVGYIRHTDLYDAAYGIAGATVDVPGIGSTTTNADGYYSFNDTIDGQFTICASAPGYAEDCRLKDVVPEITNWGSILLDVDPGDDDDAGDDDAGDDDAGDDDAGDDDAGDDDAGDDDAGDDDAGDDDAGDDDDAPNPVLGGARRSFADDAGGQGCRSSLSGGGGLLGLLLLALGWRRRP